MQEKSIWLNPWSERPIEQAILFNPAFCGELIGRTVVEYQKIKNIPLPFEFGFVILPLILHKETREKIPARSNKKFATWAKNNKFLITELPNRIKLLRPISRESLIFGIKHNILTLNRFGIESYCNFNIKIQLDSPDANDNRKVATSLGKWFGRQDSHKLILQVSE